MEFNKIIAVAGKPGLFKVITQSQNRIIVESLTDKKRVPVNNTQDVSLLENIAIYTLEEEVPLLTIFKTMFEKSEGKQTLSHKESSNKLTGYFSEILPNYDEERVYTSNIKKIVQWYNALVAVGFNFSEIEATVTEEEDSN